MSSLTETLSRVVQRATGRAIEAAQLVTVQTLDRRLRALRTYLEEIVMTTAETTYDAVLARVAAYYGVLLAENASLRNTIAEKDVALKDAGEFIDELSDVIDTERTAKAGEITAAVTAALELDAQRDAARIEEILRQAGEALPAPVPPVEVPPAGEPAEVPTDDSGEPVVEPVDEETLPVTDPSTPDVDPVPSAPETEPGDTPDAGEEVNVGEAGGSEAPFPREDVEPVTDEAAPVNAVEVPAASDVAEPGSPEQATNADNL